MTLEEFVFQKMAESPEGSELVIRRVGDHYGTLQGRFRSNLVEDGQFVCVGPQSMFMSLLVGTVVQARSAHSDRQYQIDQRTK